MSVTGINQLTSFHFDQESPILLSGTITGSLFICSKMVRYTASVCSSVVPSGLDLFVAQPMLPGQDSLLAQPIFRPRLLALGYLSSPIHGIAPWPAAIITTIAPRSIFDRSLIVDNLNVLGFDVYPVPRLRICPYFGHRRVPRPTPTTLSLFWALTCTPSYAHDLVLGRSLNHVQCVQSFALVQQI